MRKAERFMGGILVWRSVTGRWMGNNLPTPIPAVEVSRAFVPGRAPGRGLPGRRLSDQHP